MTFFYDLNKKLADINDKPTPKQLNEGKSAVDEGILGSIGQTLGKGIKKAGKAVGKALVGPSDQELASQLQDRMYPDLKKVGKAAMKPPVKPLPMAKPRSPIAKEEYGPLEEKDMGEGNAFAHAVRKAKADGIQPGEKINVGGKEYPVKEADMDESALQAYLGKKKYGEKGMKALQKAGRDGASKKTMDRIRDQHDKMDEGWDDMMKAVDKRHGQMKKGEKVAGHKGEIEKTDKGIKHTRRYDAKTGETDTGDNDSGDKKEKRRGRPKGTGKSMGAKGPSGKSKLMTKEAGHDSAELKRAMAMLKKAGYKISKAKEELDELSPETIASYQKKAMPQAADASNPKAGQRTAGIVRSIGKEDLDETEMGFSKVEKAVAKNPKVKNTAAVAAAIGRKKLGQKEMTRRSVAGRKDEAQELDELSPDTIASYQKKAMPQAADASNPKAGQRTAGVVRSIGRTSEAEELDEKAVSKQQQKFMGMVHAMQKGEKVKGASPELKKVAKTMKKSDAEDFAKTKHKGLPKKVKDGKAVKEEETETPKSKGGVQFGKGIYDSMNRELEQMIAESMNISMNMSDGENGGPSKSITVTATDEDAQTLGKLLQMAGLGRHGHEHGGEPCPTCGESPCGCAEQVDENQPDWPTETEYSDDALQYSGGLNKPKTTVAGDGQTTVPVTAVQVREEAEEELDEQEQVMAPESKDQELDEELQRIREMAGIKEAAKPDYIDLDKDGNKKESMKKAADDAKKDKKVEESILNLTNLWKAYKG